MAWWGGFALLFFLLSLGPTVDIDHDRTWPNPANPIHLIFYYVFPRSVRPFTALIEFCSRYKICLGLGAAVGVQQWCQNRVPTQRRWRAMAVCLGMLVELIVLSHPCQHRQRPSKHTPQPENT